ncbi:DNA internalization-related competence protein ComEC/Rec2 [Rhodohalobacter sp. 8-1]|uniref:DNA internalization-related competence protein ComEC/Rec2 n=1 Tax=Rhodohalobacter sp. 8-1 TaxID=3131972 RepID=UPI0030EEFE6B
MSQHSTYHFPFASYPALRVALLLIGGIILAHLSGSRISLATYLATFTALFITWAVIEFSRNSHLKLWKSTLTIILYSMMAVCFGAGLMSAEQYKQELHQTQTAPLQLYEWETITIQGEIQSRGKSSGGRNVYEVNVKQTHFPDVINWLQLYTIRVYGNDGDPLIPESHQSVEAQIRLYGFPEKRNPHEFDYGSWLLSRSIVAHGELEYVIHSESGRSLGWITIRQHVRSTIDDLFDKNEASLAKALFIGYKKELTGETRQAFSRAGLSHIMAVSGMHVGFIVAPFWLLIPWLWRWTWGKYLGVIILTLILIGYAGLTGFSASVSRASIMAWLLTYGKLFQKLRHSVNLLAVAALILLLIHPSELFDVGFQLSFSAVLIILLIMPEAQRLIPLRYRYNWKGGLMTIVLISVLVQSGLFPILAVYFGEFSVIGPVANALVVPLLGVVVPAGLLLSVAGPWFGDAASLFSIPIGWSLRWIGEVANNAGGTSWSYLSVADLSLWIFPVWLCLVLTVASFRIPRLRWKLSILFLGAANIMLMDLFIQEWNQNKLTLTMLDVGQGDAIHIETPSGKHILVDAGRWSPGGNSGERTIIPYLEYKQVDKLDAVMLSHPHADHIGGMPDLIKSIPIRTIYQSDYEYDSRLYERYMSLADSANIRVHYAESGGIIDVDPAVRLFILGPDAATAKSGNVNNSSLSFRLDYGETSFLFTGDAEAAQERTLAKRYGNFLDIDFLKTGHHGSKTSSSPRFLNYATPEITATSVAFQNRFGHPNREAVTYLAGTGAKNYFTSLSGALIFTSDGETIKREQ